MAADDMADLVRDHALHFVGTVGGVDQAGMDIDDLAPATKALIELSLISTTLALAGERPAATNSGLRHVV